MPTKNIVFVLSLSFFSLAATAIESGGDEKCLQEAQKLCPGLTMQNGLGKCMRSRKSEFSNECQAKSENMKAEFKATFKDCKDDIKTVCKDVSPGGGRIIKCLKENSARLSPTCKAHVDKSKRSS